MKWWNPCHLFIQLLLLPGSMPWLQGLEKHATITEEWILFNSSIPFFSKDTLLPITWQIFPSIIYESNGG